MKKQNLLLAYIFIGIGIYFLLKQLKVPIFTNFYSWPTLLIIIGGALLLHSHSSKNDQNLFSGIILLGLGIHFHGLEHYSFWIKHWAVYPFVIGIAFLIRSFRSGHGLLTGIILIVLSSLFLFSITLPNWFNWIYTVIDLFEKYWPVALIILGFYLLKKKK